MSPSNSHCDAHIYGSGSYKKVLPVPDRMTPKVWKVQSWTGSLLKGSHSVHLSLVISSWIADFTMNVLALSSVLQESTGLILCIYYFCILDFLVLICLQDQRETKERRNAHSRWSMANFFVCRIHVRSGRPMERVISKSPSGFRRCLFDSVSNWIVSTHGEHWYKPRLTNTFLLLQAQSIRSPKLRGRAMPGFMAWLMWLQPLLHTLPHRFGLSYFMFCQEFN